MTVIRKLFLYPFRLLYSCIRFIFKVFLAILLFKDHRIATSCDITRGVWYLFKKKVKFPHPIGIVIGMKVELGINCTIYQNVTIGTKDILNFKPGVAKYPIIGNDVTICANSVIFGDIVIGDNVIIGAASMVMQNVPDDCIVAGNPAKIIKVLKNNG